MGRSENETGRRSRRWLAPTTTFLVLACVTLVGALVAHNVERSTEQRLLEERARTIDQFLGQAVSSASATLEVLAHTTSADPTRFEQAAQPMLSQNSAALLLVKRGEDGYETLAAVGPLADAGLHDYMESTADRALEEGELVIELVDTEDGLRTLSAQPSDDGTHVVVQESIVSGAEPIPAQPDSPFQELDVVLYSGEEIDADRLVLTTTEDVPLEGDVATERVTIGVDDWLLVTKAKNHLGGWLAQWFAWLILGIGLVAAALAAGVIASISRRREMALHLAESTAAELDSSEAARAVGQATLAAVFSACPDVVVVMGPDGQIEYQSPAAMTTLGLAPDETEDLWSRVHPADAEDLNEHLTRLTFGVDQDTWTSRIQHVDGHWLTLECHGAGLRAEGGGTGRSVVVSRDITQRAELERMEREAREAAEAANRSKSEFLSRMSHELRTPLNAVLGFGQILELEDLEENQRDSVHHILRGGRHLLDLIDGVLDISRIEVGRLLLSPEAVQVGGLVEELVDLVRPLAAGKQIHLTAAGAHCHHHHVFADRQRLRQIVLNLLSNGIKYNSTGGTVAVSCSRPAEGVVRISVADTGPGIRPEHLGLLFSPFERLGAEQTDVEGTGIGLALSAGLAEAMGGKLGVDTTLGEGSTFWVDLPVVEAPVDRFERLNGTAEAPSDEPTRPQQRHKVLYIEDNLSNLKLVERVLESRPTVELIPAMQGRLGLDLVREHKPIAVLLDLHLPDTDGATVLAHLRDNPETSSIPVIILSADATHGQMQRLLSAGAMSYLTKPLDVPTLLRIVDGLLAKAASAGTATGANEA